MTCGFCGREIPEDTVQEACGHCPGGCRYIHCPHCGYRNPAPRGLLKKWLKKPGDTTKE